MFVRACLVHFDSCWTLTVSQIGCAFVSSSLLLHCAYVGVRACVRGLWQAKLSKQLADREAAHRALAQQNEERQLAFKEEAGELRSTMEAKLAAAAARTRTAAVELASEHINNLRAEVGGVGLSLIHI